MQYCIVLPVSFLMCCLCEALAANPVRVTAISDIRATVMICQCHVHVWWYINYQCWMPSRQSSDSVVNAFLTSHIRLLVIR